MLFPEPFPEDILEEIREYPGNDKCCDCPSLDTDWASVTHGTLICLDCAGKHRSLGVQVSFVRSITMDTWSKQQVEMMRQGGNGQIRRFFKKLEIEHAIIQTLYHTKAAEHYREKLKERVESIMSGEIKSERRILKKKSSTTLSGFLLEDRERRSLGGSASGASSSGNYAVDKVYQVSFCDGPMGMTLTKNHREHASVSRLVSEGQAQTAGVGIGDVVVGVGGMALQHYDDIMERVSLLPRPLVLDFAHLLKKSSPKKATSPHNHSSPPQQHTQAASTSAPATPARPSPSSSSTPSTESSNIDTTLPFTMSLTRGETFIQSRSGESLSLSSSPLDISSNGSLLENVQRLSLQGELGASSADSTSSRLHPAIGEYQVVFNNAPLGLTLSSNRRKQAEVIRIKTDGNAEKAGVQVGDILCQVDRFNVEQYEEAMKILPGCVYPLLLRFRRESRALTSSASSSALLSLPHSQQPAHILRNNLKSRAITSLLDGQDEDDNKPSILDMPTPIRFANPSSSNTTIFFPPQPSLQTSKSYQDNTSEYLINSLEASRSQDSINAASSFPPSLSSSLNGSVHSKSLEFDIVLHEEGEVGFHLEEPIELTASVVVKVTEHSAAHHQGLRTGCVVTGINKEKYLSHAHTVATLKHGKRPLVVRFRANQHSDNSQNNNS